MYEEKRKSTRIKKALTLLYCSDLDKAKNVWVIAFLRDISENGISFSADKDFLPGEILNVRIKFPFKPFQWTELKGKNVSSQESRTGIYIIHLEFIDLQEEQKKTIKEYLTWILDKEGGRK